MTAFFCRSLRRSISAGLVLIVITFAGALTACGGSSENGGDRGRIQVVTTLPLFADFVRNIGGDRVDVTALLPSGSDPHTWEPAPSDVKRITEADIAFANGLDLEPAAIKVMEANLSDDARLVSFGELVQGVSRNLFGGGPAGDSGSLVADPHLWMDVTNARAYVQFIQLELAIEDPAHASSFSANYDQYLLVLIDAETYVRSKIAAIPDGQRKLVTTHDAFGYFASAFDLELVAVVAHSPGQESSPQDIANLVRTIRDQDVPAVFGEPQVEEEGRILQQAAEDAGVEFCTLYSDSLDDRVTSYIELMRFNADELARCLGGP